MESFRNNKLKCKCREDISSFSKYGFAIHHDQCTVTYTDLTYSTDIQPHQLCYQLTVTSQSPITRRNDRVLGKDLLCFSSTNQYIQSMVLLSYFPFHIDIMYL